jgi:hypothetical protein
MQKLLSLCLIISLIIGTVPLLSCSDKPQTDLPYGVIVDKYINVVWEYEFKDERNNLVSHEEALQRVNTEVIYARVPLTVEARNDGADGWLTVQASCNLKTLGFHQDAQNVYAAKGESELFRFEFWISMTEWAPYENTETAVNAFTVQAVNVADLAD